MAIIKYNFTVYIIAIVVTFSVLGVLIPVIGAFVHNAGSCFAVLYTVLL